MDGPLLERPHRRQNHSVVETDTEVGIDVLEKDISLPAGEEDRWCRQWLLARALEVPICLIRVREQSYGQGQFVSGFDERGRSFTADGEQLVPELRKLSRYFFQLDQLVATESSPPAAVKD